VVSRRAQLWQFNIIEANVVRNGSHVLRRSREAPQNRENRAK